MPVFTIYMKESLCCCLLCDKVANPLSLYRFSFSHCLCLFGLCARLFICALWSPAWKGLTSGLSFVVSTMSLSLSYWYPGSGVVLDCIDS